MITERMMYPLVLASNHPIIHMTLLIAGIFIRESIPEIEDNQNDEANSIKEKSLRQANTEMMISHMICIILHVCGDLFSIYNKHVNQLIDKE